MKLSSNQPLPKVVVVHRGARDAYQASLALQQAGLLQELITDLYWPAERRWARSLGRLLPVSARRMLAARHAPGLPSSQVRVDWPMGPLSFLLDKLPRAPFSWRRQAQRTTDASLGTWAGKRAAASGAALLSYSYYGYHAFSAYGQGGMLFQLHPHPASIRTILAKELEDHPDCAASLRKEWELSLPEEDFARLVAETRMASQWIVASSFTRRTLLENGIPADSIAVVPYGVDLQKFSPALGEQRQRNANAPLRLLFVGTINQRKGIKYLLEAMRLLGSRRVELTVCGRVVDDLSLFRSFGPNVQVRPSVRADELLAAYRQADLFVFPSVAEGFGQVLLEALACGLPILSTTSTAAPDLVTDGVQGFVVDPRRPDLLAGRIEWALLHRAPLAEMRIAARQRAETFTWQRFRLGIVEAVRRHLAEEAAPKELVNRYV